jgi:hypothetical protein
MGGNPNDAANATDSILTNIGISPYGGLTYGFRRYGNCLDRNGGNATTGCNDNLVNISDGANLVTLNKISGGAVWEWTWNGMEFVNNGLGSFGRQMGADMFYCDVDDQQEKRVFNPNQVGALSWWDGCRATNPAQACAYYPFEPQKMLGAPLVDLDVTEVASGIPRSTVHSIPLEFNYRVYPGASFDNPVLIADMQFGTRLTLNVDGGTLRQGTATIAKFETLLRNAQAIPNNTNKSQCSGVPTQIEIPMLHVVPELYKFHYIKYDGRGNVTQDSGLFEQTCTTATEIYPPSGGTAAALVQNVSGTHAIAFFTRLADPIGEGGFVKLNVSNQSCGTDLNSGQGEFDDYANQLQALYVAGVNGISSSSTDKSFPIYVVTGTPGNVVSTLANMAAHVGSLSW